MKTKFIVIILLVLCSTIDGIAQDKDALDIKRVIKCSPMSLLNPFFGSIQFGYEQPLNNRTALQYDLAYGTDRLSLFGPFYNYSGLRGQVEIRRYQEKYKRGKNKFQSIGIRYQYKNDEAVTYHVNQNNYTDVLYLDRRTNSFGIHFTKGLHWINDNGLSLELGAALGLQYNFITPTNIPADVNKDDLYSPTIDVTTILPPFTAAIFKYVYGFGIFKVGYAF